MLSGVGIRKKVLQNLLTWTNLFTLLPENQGPCTSSCDPLLRYTSRKPICNPTSNNVEFQNFMGKTSGEQLQWEGHL